ncbi:hypothetical protein GCM10007857_89050 [Bradyrhizobium iriomotense]|uniref:Transposase n=1 Tax=Bradyrhizobium iriomotense TaxID=441950 RepID=A0ABQ6BGW4_9BRAD|nr:hypothetical protein GCM10007857_89050 [Bradyrhizobium iriomotense]
MGERGIVRREPKNTSPAFDQYVIELQEWLRRRVLSTARGAFKFKQAAGLSFRHAAMQLLWQTVKRL